MGYKTAFSEVMREYERDRARTRTVMDKKRKEVYESLPRIYEIDNQLRQVNLKLARKLILNGDANALSECKRENDALLAEKRRLLSSSRFGADYLSETYKCPHCRDTGFIDKKRCSCLTQRLVEKYYNLSNLNGVLQNENFETFDLKCYSTESSEYEGISPRAKMRKTLELSKDFVEHLKQSQPAGNFLFYGNPGLGKTFLCNCIAKALLDSGLTVLYTTAPKLFKALEEYRFNRNNFDTPESIEALTEVDLLIIDDLGTEVSTLVTSSELFSILNTRLLENRSTIISTNLSPGDFENQYSERIVSRFIGYFKMIKFFGEDIRAKKKYRQVL
jgi:DNA replication protein DnaC